MCKTLTSISSPFLATSEGLQSRWDHEMSEMWTNPSMPSSSPMKTPKSVMFRTRPLTMQPTG